MKDAELRARAVELLRRFKGESYAFGTGALERVGPLAAGLGGRALLAANDSAWLRPAAETVRRALSAAGARIAATTGGARPNSPYEDVFRLRAAIEAAQPDFVVGLGGGSTLDALKAAVVLAALTPGRDDLEPFFGTGLVTAAARRLGARVPPILAVQTAASSASHLTKYANVTNMAAGQKKLIIDEALTPARAVFDYRLSATMSPELTRDGALDGISHNLEVYLGARGALLEKVEPIALTGIELIVTNLPRALADGNDERAREGLGLGTDLGGYAIMTGGTNGAHLNSFSLVDLLPHGRACALLNPYYVVFFAPAVERQLRAVGAIYRRAGHLEEDVERLSGRALGAAVARAMQRMHRAIGFPTRLRDVPGFREEHIRRALAAAKNPQLVSKLQQMPVPMTAADVDRRMGSVLAAAAEGDFDLIEPIA